MMKELLIDINSLVNSPIKKIVDKKMSGFRRILDKKNENILFSELCFCLLTANFNAKRAIHIQNKIKSGFKHLSKEELASRLKELGHRFPNARSKYIVEARKHDIKKILDTYKDEKKIREWLTENVLGLGFKESSHYLRNIGFINIAIIDFHIIDILVKNNLIIQPKTLTKQKYIEIENILSIIARKSRLNLGELDFYLWYMETKKILK